MKKTSVKPKRSSAKSSRPAETHYALKKNIMHREVEGQILILTPREEFLYTINESGKVLWELLVRGATEQKLVNALVRRYELSRTQAQGDVQEFLKDLRAKGILARK